MKRKILVAIDGSVYSSNSLDYLIRLFKNNSNVDIVLLSVVSAGNSDQNWMLDVDPLRTDTPAVELRKAKAERYMRVGRDRLLRHGFREEQIDFSIQSSSSALATSIYHQAKQGMYDSLLVGRRGVGKIGEMFLGSVSADLLVMCHEVPLWIIDGEVTSNRFLLAVHCTPPSLWAVDHLSFIMSGHPDTEIYLYHSSAVFGSTQPSPMEEFYEQWGEEWCREHLDLDNFLYQAHTRLLLDNGFQEKQIFHIPPHRDLDASHDLLRQAEQYDCGTIVMGRRGRDADKGILGGVSDRTTHQAQNMAIWLVG